MGDNLLKLCEDTRYQFIRVDLEICRSALKMGAFELSLGNVEIARRESDSVEKAILTIEHFLPGIPPERRKDLERELGAVKAEFAGFRSFLGQVAS